MAFLRQLQINFVVDEATFRTDMSKVVYALPFCRDGVAGAWAEAYIDKAAVEKKWDSWADFEEKLKQTFSDPNERQNAQNALNALRQGR